MRYRAETSAAAGKLPLVPPIVLAIASLALLLGSCSTMSQAMSGETANNIEPMLLAAGFRSLPAATAEQKASLKSLPALQLNYYADQNGIPHYWLADPDNCQCLLHGDEAAYHRYEIIRLQNEIAEREQRRLNMQQAMGPPLGFPSAFPGAGIGIAF
jgi:hypothetical protein